jgi:hemolysin activation/secretion protein
MFYKEKNITLIIIFFLFANRAVYAQPNADVERATRETERVLDKEKIEKQLRKIPEKPAEIKPAEKVVPKKKEEKFFISKIILSGCQVLDPEAFSKIIFGYENKEVSFSDLNALSKDIQREYLRNGYFAAVLVQPQDIRNKVVTLQVVEAKMGNLIVEKGRFFSESRLRYYWHIKEGEPLDYFRLSRSVQLMNKNPDRIVKATLVAGAKPGTTDVVLTPETNFPLHFSSSYDREGVPATGRSRITLGMRNNNLLGLDDSLLSGYVFGQSFNGKYVYHNLPISSYGTSLLYGYSRSESIPKKEYASLGLYSYAQDATVSLRQDIFKKDEYLGEVFLGFDARDKTTKEDTGVYSRDRLRILRLGVNLIKRWSQSVFTLSPQFSQGLNAFGASGNNNPLASGGGQVRIYKA